MITRRVASLLLACIAGTAGWAGAAECKRTVYLTIDTGWSAQADTVIAALRKHDVRATFFLANERSWRGDYTLDPSWSDFWKARVAEGHAFGSHTWHHGAFRGDLEDGRTQYVHMDGRREALDEAQFCAELRRVGETFERMTGRKLDPYWRAPGGWTTPRTLEWGNRCGFRHVHWANAGFLGDELPSDKYPNDTLLQRALRNIRDGDVLMMHLGIRSRRDPFAPMLDPLLTGLKERGFCFATLPERDAAKAPVRTQAGGRS
jgi:peptidoglycan/xylan/chitin deacetylase (PgdA/CDA1 family)